MFILTTVRTRESEQCQTRRKGLNLKKYKFLSGMKVNAVGLLWLLIREFVEFLEASKK